MNETVLQHWGIKGQKWGIRRYQNKDGTLTALGRKREKEMNAKLKSANKELKALKAENEALKKQSSANSRNVSEMSDDELQQRINRLNLEKRYNDAYREVHPNTDKPSAGKAFLNKMLNEAVIPSVTNVGKSLIEKSLKKAFGLEDKPDQSKALDAAMKKLEYATKQVDYESKKFDLDKKRNAGADKNKQSDNKPNKDKTANNNSNKDKSSNKDETSDKDRNKDKASNDKSKDYYDANYKTKNSTSDTKKSSSEDYEYFVFPNEKKSGGRQDSNREKRSYSETVWDAEWRDISDTPSSSVNTNTARLGQSFVTALLEAPKSN